ncbi:MULTISPECIES: response regulator [Afifella]|uniref:response regulator n=1 Tax=Afifella TaxID=643217 RepID=UPI000FE30B71|nr:MULTISPECIES: response regulator transcription factor [Afifella]MCF1502530.1 response regulator transcription factor [Afifella sp. H1R]MCT8266190.1 response regulator transcription factor [Afifella sp. JA880]
MTLAEQAVPAELPDDAPHLLVIDDDNRIRSLLSRFLRNGGYRATVAASAEEARRHLSAMTFDLLIVDVMMPGENGMDLVASLRKTDDVPILMLTARSEAESRVRGLELGADDYLAKPFEPRELLLRISNILKRGSPPPVREIEFVRFGPFTFHLERGELKRGLEPIRLTDRERELLTAFSSRPGETVPRHELLSSSDASGERTVDVQVNRLRRKIEADPSNPVHLQTVRGIGYRLMVD